MADEATATPQVEGFDIPPGTRILLGVPAYNRIVYTNCLVGIVNLVTELSARKVGMRLQCLSDALINRVRNSFAAATLAGNFTHLLMVDADVGFSPQAVLRMLAFDKDVTGCAVPKRQYETKSFPEGGAANWPEAEAHMARFTAELIIENQQMQVVRGFARARHIATALILIKRGVFETMIAKGVVEKIRPDAPLKEERRDFMYGFFEPASDPDRGGMYLAEDFAFCRRWRHGCGGEIWCDVQGQYTHIGPHEFRANVLKAHQLREERAARLRPKSATPAAE